MTTLFLDVEFNGHGGRLLSLALASPCGRHWYGLMPNIDPETLTPWVAEHVYPLFTAMPRTAAFLTEAEFRLSVINYLRYQRGAVTVVADYPGDFTHLMRLFEGANFQEAWMPRMKFDLVVTPDGQPKPEIPHNALSDAIALMRWYQSCTGGP